MNSSNNPASDYFEGWRRSERVVETATMFGLAMPFVARRLPARIYINPYQPLHFFLRMWFPRNHGVALVVGAMGGLLEDFHTRLSYDDTFHRGEALEVEMWTLRSLSPALLFFASPWLALKCLDGELKGSDTALANIENRPLQEYPFFAVLDVYRPSPDTATTKYRHVVLKNDYMTVFLHLLRCRLDGTGFYNIRRHPKNDKWRII